MTDLADRSTAAEATPDVDVAALGELLLGRWADARRHSRSLMAREEFHRIPGLGMDEHRARTFGQLRRLVEEKAVHRAFPARFGGDDDHGGNIAAFEEVLLGDPSLQIKSGVQWGLFGAAVLHLGTERHHDEWLPAIMSMEVPGAFAMTQGMAHSTRSDLPVWIAP